MLELSLLFMAAGKSSRYGGEPKFLAKIGPNKETLFEISFQQIIKYINVKHIHLVLNEDNALNILQEVKDVRYKYDLEFDLTSNIQEIPRYRNKPWGTGEAAASAWSYMKGPFLLLNSDDLYDEKTFEQISKECDENKNYIIGYELGKTLKNKNKANRGFIEEKDGIVKVMKEKLNIERMYYNESELKNIFVSVNLFLLQPSILMCLLELAEDFKKENDSCLIEEALLPDFINKIINKDKMELHLIKSKGEWNGITFKTDLAQIKKQINI
jgi:choline kinase